MSFNRLPHVGDTVRIREARWRVESRVDHGEVVDLHVTGLERDDRGRRTCYLLPFDRCERLPHDERPRRVRRTEWQRIARRILADATPAWQSLRCAARARLSIIPFQLEPALALVQHRACRFLIADAVGLGKTIQAGLMIAETLERTAAGRVLVIVPAGLRDQWVSELRERFALEATLLDATSIPRATAGAIAGANPWAAVAVAVTSIDFVKRPEVIRALEGLVWDLIVFDEAHTLAGRSDRAAAATGLAGRARAVVMLTATPHSGDEAAFERLRAIGDLGRAFPLLTFRRTRAALGAKEPRRVRYLRIRPTAPERAMHDRLDRYTILVRAETDSPGAHLAMSVLSRRASSSAASLAISVERRITLLSETVATAATEPLLPFRTLEDGDASPDEELAEPAFADRDAELQELRMVLAAARLAAASESKLHRLARLLARIGDTAIVFTQYRDTLATLAAALRNDPAMLHGGLTSSERRDQARRFTHGNARLLLATDAASEGLNLQRRCRLVVHLEMPWTPTRLEQRIGRVDRLGQRRRVHSIHLIASDTSEDDVTERVRQRQTRSDQALDGEPVDLQYGGVGNGRSLTRTVKASIEPSFLEDECVRIQTARRLDIHAARTIPGRPVATTSRSRLGPAIWATRVPFADAGGAVIWESIAALLVTRSLGAAPDALARTEAGQRALRQHVDWQLTRLRRSIDLARATLLSREEAIADELTAQRGRLSAALLQRGLFEHRRERLASAQDAVLRAALARLAERKESLERLRRIVVTDPVGLFAISPPQ